MSLLRDGLIAFSLLITAYFVFWNVSQIAMSPLAIGTLWRHRLRNTRRARGLASGVAVPRFVSIVAPAYNEELTIVESLRALLAVDYQPREIVIVNDGSTDGTLAVMQKTFQLVPAPVAFERTASTTARPSTHVWNPAAGTAPVSTIPDGPEWRSWTGLWTR